MKFTPGGKQFKTYIKNVNSLETCIFNDDDKIHVRYNSCEQWAGKFGLNMRGLPYCNPSATTRLLL